MGKARPRAGGRSAGPDRDRDMNHDYWREEASLEAADRIRELEDALNQALSILGLAAAEVEDRRADTREIKHQAEQVRRHGYLVLRGQDDDNGVDT